jgi:hypothetical protein
MNRGWSSEGLPVVAEDPHLWTLTHAAGLLGPPQLTPAQLRTRVRVAGLVPVGKRRVTESGHSGRHARVYRATELIQLYESFSEE